MFPSHCCRPSHGSHRDALQSGSPVLSDFMRYTVLTVMDLSRLRGDCDRSRQLRQSSSRAEPHAIPDGQFQAHDSTLPQRSRIDADNAHLIINETEIVERHSSQTLNTPENSQQHYHRGDRSPQSLTSPRRRRPASHDPPIQRAQHLTSRSESLHVTLLYPQMNPYADHRLSTHSAPDELEHSHSQHLEFEDGVAFVALSSPGDTALENSPRPSVQRTYTAPSAVDTTPFDDDEEFSLFVLATTGLGLDAPFDPSFSPPPIYAQQQQQRRPQPCSPPSRNLQSEHRSSRRKHQTQVTEAPRQPQNLSHMPHPTHRPRPSLTLQIPGSHATSLAPDVSPLEEDFDTDLPNYAESQAQAQSARRMEAARRAQELQRRWQMSGARRPT